MKSIVRLFIFLMALCTSYSCAYASSLTTTHLVGKCNNSYFIKQQGDILSTMNLLINSDSISQNVFTCNDITISSTADQNYLISIHARDRKSVV